MIELLIYDLSLILTPYNIWCWQYTSFAVDCSQVAIDLVNQLCHPYPNTSPPSILLHTQSTDCAILTHCILLILMLVHHPSYCTLGRPIAPYGSDTSAIGCSRIAVGCSGIMLGCSRIAVGCSRIMLGCSNVMVGCSRIILVGCSKIILGCSKVAASLW